MDELYRVKLDVFEGPLDLLLHLIKKNEVEIVDIPIATVTEQYLAYLDTMRELRLDIAGEFLVMAATLTLIKSRMLLPPSEDEEDAEEDPRADLVRQLLEYQRYREAALDLSERPFLNRDVFVRESAAGDEECAQTADPPRLRVTVWELLEALRAVLVRVRPDSVHEVVTDPVSMRDRARALLRALSVARRLDFDSLFDDTSNRLVVLVTFLALLELMKLGTARAVQEGRFGRIVIELAVEDPAAISFDGIDEYGGRPTAGEGAEDGHGE